MVCDSSRAPFTLAVVIYCAVLSRLIGSWPRYPPGFERRPSLLFVMLEAVTIDIVPPSARSADHFIG
jgi:hypothetical protein